MSHGEPESTTMGCALAILSVSLATLLCLSGGSAFEEEAVTPRRPPWLAGPFARLSLRIILLMSAARLVAPISLVHI